MYTLLTFEMMDEAALTRLGQRLAMVLVSGDLVRLEGPLGSGKTTLARSLIRAVSTPDEEVPSPTFALVQHYDTQKGNLWHLDLYRLAQADDVWELGFEEMLEDGICLVEWPEKAEHAMPSDALRVVLAHQCDDAGVGTGREVTFSVASAYSDRWRERLHGLKQQYRNEN